MKSWCRTSILILSLLLCCISAIFAATPKGVVWKKLKDSKPGLYKTDIVYPQFTAKTPLAKAAGLAFKKSVNTDVRNTVDGAEEIKKDDPHFQPFELDITTTLGVVSPSVISGYLTTYNDSGGAHPNTYYEPITYALVDNHPKRLTLKDIIKPDVSSGQLAAKILIPKVNKIKKERSADTVGSIEAGYLDHFVVTPKGITWMFSPYDIGAYAEGDYIVDVPWASLKSVLRSNGPLKSIAGW